MSQQSIPMSSGRASQQVVTALFDTQSDAMKAIDALAAAGIPRSAARMMPGTEASVSQTRSYDIDRDEKGFWASLADLFLPDDDRSTYAEAMHRGKTLVSVTVGAGQTETVADILEEYGSVDIDETEAGWRSEGWTGTATAASAATERSTSSGSGMAGSSSSSMAGSRSGSMSGSAASGMGTSGTETSGSMASSHDRAAGRSDEEVIPIVEERLHVGKREVNEGRVRVRSYVIETPVNEEVSLRREHVDVSRRPVDRPISDADRLFQDRTIEAEARSEEAVVAKDARVVEELVVSKTSENETRTVSDSVRRTEVEVEDERDETRKTRGT
jgi:uncharacterized protein (TIGR02271 family)